MARLRRHRERRRLLLGAKDCVQSERNRYLPKGHLVRTSHEATVDRIHETSLAKVDVNGETADPLFTFLATEKPFAGFGKGLKNAALNKFADMNNKQFGDKAYIKWNFTKFLVDREGRVIARFEPTVDMEQVRSAVEKELA